MNIYTIVPRSGSHCRGGDHRRVTYTQHQLRRHLVLKHLSEPNIAYIHEQTRMNMNNSDICVIASIKEVLYTIARTRSLDFALSLSDQILLVQKSVPAPFQIKAFL